MYKMLSSEVTDKQNSNALVLSSKLLEPRQRKRAYADFLGVMYAVDYLQNSGYRVNIQRSIFKSAKLYSDFEICDIYSNSHRLYVVTAYGTEIVKIPYMHKKYDILPEAYIVVELQIGMKEANVKGIIKPVDFENAEINNDYFKFNTNELRNIEELYEIIKNYSGIKPSIGKHLECMDMFVPYTEDKLTDNEKKKFIEHILTCETCKKRLMDTLEFDSASKNIVKRNNILSNEDFSKEETFIRKLQNSNREEIKIQGAIDTIYNENSFNELKNSTFRYGAEIPPKTKKIILTGFFTVAILLVIISFAANLPKGGENQKAKTVQGEVIDTNETNLSQSQGGDFDIYIPKIDKSKGYLTISKVSWEVSKNINNEEQKKFLQQAGKSVRLNLQNDLLLSNTTTVNNKVKFDIRFYRDGSLENVELVQSSGNSALDKVIQQSLQNTLYYMRPPKGSFVGKKNSLTIVIDF